MSSTTRRGRRSRICKYFNSSCRHPFLPRFLLVGSSSCSSSTSIHCPINVCGSISHGFANVWRFALGSLLLFQRAMAEKLKAYHRLGQQNVHVSGASVARRMASQTCWDALFYCTVFTFFFDGFLNHLCCKCFVFDHGFNDFHVHPQHPEGCRTVVHLLQSTIPSITPASLPFVSSGSPSPRGPEHAR